MGNGKKTNEWVNEIKEDKEPPENKATQTDVRSKGWRETLVSVDQPASLFPGPSIPLGLPSVVFVCLRDLFHQGMFQGPDPSALDSSFLISLDNFFNVIFSFQWSFLLL